jgi:hypothetical protein
MSQFKKALKVFQKARRVIGATLGEKPIFMDSHNTEGLSEAEHREHAVHHGDYAKLGKPGWLHHRHLEQYHSNMADSAMHKEMADGYKRRVENV